MDINTLWASLSLWRREDRINWKHRRAHAQEKQSSAAQFEFKARRRRRPICETICERAQALAQFFICPLFLSLSLSPLHSPRILRRRNYTRMGLLKISVYTHSESLSLSLCVCVCVCVCVCLRECTREARERVASARGAHFSAFFQTRSYSSYCVCRVILSDL